MLPGSYAEVVVGLKNRRTDRIFHYAIPENLIKDISLGVQVRVPFGHREVDGYVVGFTAAAEVKQLKEIKQVISDRSIFSQELLLLARWVAIRYLCPLGTVLAGMSPPGFKTRPAPLSKYQVTLRIEQDEAKEIIGQLAKKAPRQAQLLRYLASNSMVFTTTVKDQGFDIRLLRELEKKGYVEISPVEEAAVGPVLRRASVHTLTGEQEKAVAAIKEALNCWQASIFLLYGVTGSGKTEVYLRSITRVLQQGRQAIVLVPEIALTSQVVSWFRMRLGNKVVLLHSGLPLGERYQAWKRIKEGKAQVVIGTRSAVFAPVPRLGLIIIDEEHEQAYKQENDPKYHTREVALRRAQLNQAVVVLGSATPSFESYTRTCAGKFQLLRLTKRVGGKPLPAVQVVDMRTEMKKGTPGLFSRVLQLKMQERLARGEQCLLFLNRRGFANLTICRDCGLILKCPRCDISLSFHAVGTLRCHYCGYRQFLPKVCPQCGVAGLFNYGAGTQRVEAEAKRLFPNRRVLRMDTDSTSGRGAHEKIFREFLAGAADILVGTQMIAKGLEFPQVTLVGVVNADTMLNLPDFRAHERTFQLLTQVAGRTGRGPQAGEVVVQTFNPSEFSILAAGRHDFEGFFRVEIKKRYLLGYPPYTHLIRILISGNAEDKVKAGIGALYTVVKQQVKISSAEHVELLGPAPALISRIKNKYRWQILVKGNKLELIRRVVDVAVQLFMQQYPSRVGISLDVDPLGMW